MRLRSSFGFWCTLAVAVSAASVVLSAQEPKPKGKDAKTLLVVPALQSTDKQLGYEAAVQVRSHIDDNADTRQLWVVPQERIDQTLQESDYNPHDPVTDQDAKTLAGSLAADYYLIGTATTHGDSVTLNTKLVLNQKTAEGPSLAQPLPPASAPVKKVAKAAEEVARFFNEAAKQLPEYYKCTDAARKEDFAGALTAARAAIQVYPRSTLARLCIGTVYLANKQPDDSILRIAKEILDIDPTNRLALSWAASSAYNLKDLDDATRYWGEQLALDPSNTKSVEDVVDRIVSAGRIASALPIIDTAIAQNPEDFKLMGLKYKLLIRAGKWTEAIPLGDSVIHEDTSFADTTFYQRQTVAYESDSEPKQAADVAAQGLAKFPGNATLETAEIDALQKSSQTQREIAALHTFLDKNPKNLVFWRFLYFSFKATNQPDSVLWVLHQAAANGDTAAVLSKIALGQGLTYYQAGAKAKDADTLQLGMRYLSYSDSLAPSQDAQFYMGASQMAIISTQIDSAFKHKDCPTLRQILAMVTAADSNLRAGGRTNPDAAKQLLGYVPQVETSTSQLIKKSCK